jgi:hypothetical protein
LWREANQKTASARQSLLLRQASAANGIEIIAPADLRYRGVTFTPDNSSIYYVASARDDTFGSLYRVPLLGGAAVRLIEHVDGPVTISRTGTAWPSSVSTPLSGKGCC